MKKKNLIMILVIVGIVLLFLVLLFIKNSRVSDQYLILDNYYSLLYKDDKFVKASYDDLTKQEFAGFSNKEFIGIYEIYGKDEYDNFYFTNDESDEAYAFEMPFIFATNGIEVVSFDVEDAKSSDLVYIRDEFGYDIENVDDLSLFKKIKYDVDDDSHDDYIYYASYYDENENNSFSCIFLIKDNKFYLMGLADMYDAYEDSFLTMDSYSLGYIIKIDNRIMMIVSMESTDLAYYSIYEFDKDLKNVFGGTYD